MFIIIIKLIFFESTTKQNRELIAIFHFDENK
jgi:hypothetical protein